MNLNGSYNIQMNTLDGKNSLGNINCKTINGITSNEIKTLQGINTNSTIQNQLDSINSNISNGGGFFHIYGESPSISTIINSGYNWEFGSGSNSNKGIVIGCNCYIYSIGITSSSYPTNNAVIKIMKSTDNVTYTDSGINITLSTSQTMNSSNTNLNYYIAKGTVINFQTTSGSGSGICRLSVCFNSLGVIGPTPTLSVGTISSLPYGSTPSVTISGTINNPILNFQLITGPSNPELEGNTQGITYNSSTDTTTIDNNLFVPKNITTNRQGQTINLVTYIDDQVGIAYSHASDALTQANSAMGNGDAAKNRANDAYSLANTANTKADANTLAIAGLGITTDTELAALETQLQGEIATATAELQGQINVIDDEILALQGKTQYQTCNQVTLTTSFSNTLSVGSSISLSGGSVNCNSITTSSTSTQNIKGNVINIGSLGSVIYINGFLYDPITNFLNQWT